MKSKEYFIFIGNDGNERIRYRLITDKNEILNFVVQYEINVNDIWAGIVRFDCSHGFFHKDELYPNGKKTKKIINMDSLKTAFNFAESDIAERHEYYKDRYLKLLK